MGAADYVCSFDGCDRSALDSAIHRISPKGPGAPFIGMCTEHFRLVAQEFAELDAALPPDTARET